MEKLLTGLVETAKGNKKGLIMLKNTAIRCQQFELAAELRELERTLFPETDEEKEAKKLSKELNLVFRMVELNVAEDTCWLISQTFNAHTKMKGKFSIHDASKLIAKRKELFDEVL